MDIRQNISLLPTEDEEAMQQDARDVLQQALVTEELRVEHVRLGLCSTTMRLQP
jgi:hypothetical protein